LLAALVLACGARASFHGDSSDRLWLAWGAFGITCWQLGVSVFLISDGRPEAKGYLLPWAAFRLGIAVHLLLSPGALVRGGLPIWSAHLGAVLELMLFSVALSQRLEVARDTQTKLNGQLTRDVHDLREALTKAETDTAAKSNFLATVVHELRSPLNAIINIPQALIHDLPLVDTATCSQCNSVFELDEGESITENTTCPECHGVKTLRQARYRQLRGSADEFAANLAHVERSGKHLLQVVESILDFSRLEAHRLQLHYEETSVVELVGDALTSLEAAAHAKSIRLAIEPIPAALKLDCDPLRIRQVLVNLVGNAIKFSESGRCVSVGVKEEERALVFSVCDQGIGIAAEHVSRLFQAHDQAHQGDTQSFGRTGLGLAISRSLVQMHQGEIWVESALGQGSTFHFRIPRCPHDAAPSPELALSPQGLLASEVANDAGRASVTDVGRISAVTDAGRATLVDPLRDSFSSGDSHAWKKAGSNASGSQKALKKERLLYVEDDDAHFSVAELRLKHGYELVRAANAEQACQRLREPDANCVAVLMDVELRGSQLDGIELTKLLRGRMPRDSLPPFARDLPTAEQPIIMVTAHGAKHSEATLLLAGADKVIHKPIDFGALNVALTQLHLARSRGKIRSG
jgi:signal transduction histidine kinase/CheY-like chemotaxis protein